MTTTSRPSSFSLYFALITLPFYLLDQATKWAVIWNFPIDAEGQHAQQAIVSWQWFSSLNAAFSVERIVIPDFFYLVHWTNPGAAFSILSHWKGFFIVLSIVALVALAVMVWLGKFQTRATRVGCALLIAGILGNMTDRIVHGEVVDFLLFDLHVPFANPWPAFNVADSCIFIAAALFIWQSFREPKVVQNH